MLLRFLLLVYLQASTFLCMCIILCTEMLILFSYNAYADSCPKARKYYVFVYVYGIKIATAMDIYIDIYLYFYVD